jgi:hypothetical protein
MTWQPLDRSHHGTCLKKRAPEVNFASDKLFPGPEKIPGNRRWAVGAHVPLFHSCALV